MYHDPFVPLELALSEQCGGSLDILFFAAGEPLETNEMVDVMPPLDGG
jgi:hypothetical protein